MIHILGRADRYRNGVNIFPSARKVALYASTRTRAFKIYARIVPAWSDLRRHSRLARWFRLQIVAESLSTAKETPNG
jgi:hypothetical protein